MSTYASGELVADVRKILLVSRGAFYGRSFLNNLSSQGFELVDGYALDNSRDDQELSDALQGFWGVIAGNERYTRRVFEMCPDLRVIARFGAGYDQIDIAAAKDHGVRVVTSPAANSESVADYAVALMLAVACRVIPADRAARSETWRPDELAVEIGQSVVGVVGFGAIGRAVAQRLNGFGAEVLAFDPMVAPSSVPASAVEMTSLDDLVLRADIISLHVPGGAGTQHLVDAEFISKMKRGAILVNTCRGSVVDEEALLNALRDGQLRGAALDVFNTEPLPADSELFELPNVVLSGHVASFTAQTVASVCASVEMSFKAVANNGVPDNCVG